MEVRVFGKVIGVAEGWNDMGDFCLAFYDFVPSKDSIFPQLRHTCCLQLDPINGFFYAFDEDGKTADEYNILEMLNANS